MDLVGTCPKDFWLAWLDEGNLAGTRSTGEEYYWHTRSSTAARIKPGERFYIVAHDKVRGYAPVVRVEKYGPRAYAIVRAGKAVACTIPDKVPGFRGLRARWWDREQEIPFPDWKLP